MVKTPSSNDMYLAAQWLDIYEGEEEAQACQRVKAWLLIQADAAEFREACRAAGVSVSKARKALKAKQT